MSYRLIDLFCGAGGMTLGFHSEEFCGGFKPILGMDNDESSVLTHETNFGGESKKRNIEEWLQDSEIPLADVVIGGPPCQGFSLLNKNRQGDERRALWEPFMDVVHLSCAKIFVMENVAEFYRSPELARIQQRANELGFDICAEILNSANYGVPQTRKRTFVVGWKRLVVEAPQFPPPQTHFDPDKLRGPDDEIWLTVRDAIGELPKEPLGTEMGIEEPLNLHFGRNPTAKSQKRYRAVPEGGNRFDLQRVAPELTPACWIRKTSGGTDLFGRLWWDRPSVTIRTEFFKPEKGRYLHPTEHRPITHREAARLMGFPDGFEFVGSKVDVARQIGNAVPPPLAGAVARVVRRTLDAAEGVRRGEAANAVEAA